MDEEEGGFNRFQSNSKEHRQSGSGSRRGINGSGPVESVTPLLLSWLTSIVAGHQGDIISIDGVMLDKLVVVGKVVGVKVETTRNLINIDDGTENIVLTSNKKFDEDYSPAFREIDFSQKTLYIKAVIDVNFYNGLPIYSPIRVFMIKNLNYLSYHIASCLLARTVRVGEYPKTEAAEIKYPGAHESEKRFVRDKDDFDEYRDDHVIGDAVLNVLHYLKEKYNRPINIEEVFGELSSKFDKNLIIQGIRGLHSSNQIRKIQGQEIYDFH